MNIIFSKDIKNVLAKELNGTKSQLHVVSAYCKYQAMQFLQNNVSDKVLVKNLLVRFAFNDIVTGASDLSIYEFCKANGWNMYIRLDLHAKTYVFDRMRCIVGSANATSKGIGLNSNPNYEIAMITEINDDEMHKVELLFSNAILMTDEIYKKMQLCVNLSEDLSNTQKHNWDKDILGMFNPKVDVLFTHELPNSYSLSSLKEDSLDFLLLQPGWTIDDIKEAFLKSNCFLWLAQVLENSPNKELYFGALTEKLHNILIIDPKPYRKEVKELLSNLLNWIVELDIDIIRIDKPKHSQRITLLETLYV